MRWLLLLVAALPAWAQDAARIARASAVVHGAKAESIRYAGEINNPLIRKQTLDALQRGTCIAHRAGLTAEKKAAILEALQNAGYVERSASAMIGVFPPVVDDGLSEAAAAFRGRAGKQLSAAITRIRAGWPYTRGSIAPPIWHDWAKTIVF